MWLQLRTVSFRLPIWRRPIFNSDFLAMPVAGEAADGEHALGIWPSADLRSGNWAATTMAATRWSHWSVNRRDVARVFALGPRRSRDGGGLIPFHNHTLFTTAHSLSGFCAPCLECVQVFRINLRCYVDFTRLWQAHVITTVSPHTLHVVPLPVLSPPLPPVFRFSILCHQVQSSSL